MNEIIRFQPNVPVEIALKYSTGKRVQGRYGEQYFFSLVDGRAMYLDADVGERIHLQQFKPGERFTLVKQWNGQRGQPVRWDINRTTPDDQIVARLEESIRAVPPRRPPQSQSAPPVETRGTGTYGPAPQPRPAIAAQTPPSRIPYNVAFQEILQFVTAGLKQAGEQWNDEAKQGLVSTVLIQAARDGFLELWERAA